MLTEKQINTINNLIKDKVHKFKGGLLNNSEVTIDFNYKIKILGYREMYHVGVPYDYMVVSVEFVKFNNTVASIMLPNLKPDDSNLYFLKRTLSFEISRFLDIFDKTNGRVIIANYTISPNIDNEIVSEQNMSRIATRTVVRDITNKVKNKKRGFFYLPKDGDMYSFTNLPFSFSVELTLKIDKTLDSYLLNGYYVPDEDVMEILITFNPQKIESHLYELVGDLNELVSHELEHGLQEYRGETLKNESVSMNPLKYYTQSHEISAQYKGFKRLSKLTNKPLSEVAKKWFTKNKDIHNLTEKETKLVIERVLNYRKNI